MFMIMCASVYDYVCIVHASYQCMDACRCLTSQMCRVFIWYRLVWSSHKWSVYVELYACRRTRKYPIFVHVCAYACVPQSHTHQFTYPPICTHIFTHYVYKHD